MTKWKVSVNVRWHFKGAGLRRDQSAIRRVPAPQVVTGQLGPAPPAMELIVPAEILGLRQNSLAQGGQRKCAALVPRMTIAIIVHLLGKWSLVQPGHGRR